MIGIINAKRLEDLEIVSEMPKGMKTDFLNNLLFFKFVAKGLRTQ